MHTQTVTDQQTIAATNPTFNADTARRIIYDYFDYFGMEGVQQELWELLSAAMTSEQSENGLDRQRHLYFYVQTKMLMEAVGLVCDREEQTHH